MPYDRKEVVIIMETIREVAEQKQHGFTSDDIWDALKFKPSDGRLIGHALHRLFKMDIIRATDLYIASRRPINKRRKIRLFTAKTSHRGHSYYQNQKESK